MGTIWLDDCEVNSDDFIRCVELTSSRKIIAEVIRVEYRPLKDMNPTPNPPSIQVKSMWIISTSYSFCS